jgi:hypothetical protein
MLLDLSRFKVVYGDRVLNAVALDGIDLEDITPETDAKCVLQSKFIAVFAVNEDGNIVLIRDEAWRFQFVPIINR